MVLKCIWNAFPIFSFSEKQKDNFIEPFAHDRGGVEQLREMFGRLSRDVLEYQRRMFPAFSERDRAIFCGIAMESLWDKFERVKRRVEACHATDAVHKSITV